MIQLTWKRHIPRMLLVLCTAFFALGCAEEKESSHEDEHEKPAHWPTSLKDAAEKLDQRLGQLKTEKLAVNETEDLLEELGDLVSWAPEISADTDMTEEAWVPVYELSEELRVQFDGGQTELAAVEEGLTRLAELLRLRAQELAEPSAESGE